MAKCPDFVFNYPLPPEIDGVGWKRPLLNFADIPETYFLDLWPNYKTNNDESKKFVVFCAIAEAKSSYDSFGQILNKCTKQGILEQEFETILKELFGKGIVHTKTREKNGRKKECINAFVYLNKVHIELKQDKKHKKETAEKIQRVVVRAPKEFFLEKYEFAKEGDNRIVRPYNLSADCRLALSQESLQKIYSGNDVVIAKQRFDVFSIIALDAIVKDGKIVEEVDNRGTLKTYSEIVRRGKIFGMDVDTIYDNVLALLECGVVKTVKKGKENSNLTFFGTPFLKEAKFKRDELEEKDRGLHVQSPPFMKQVKFRAPNVPTNLDRWARRKMEKDVLVSLHKESLERIHPEYNDEDGEKHILVFNVITFGSKKEFDGSISYPDKFCPSLMTFGELSRRCATFGISIDEISLCLEFLLLRGVVNVRQDYCSYFLVSTPFLRTARLIDDPENWLEPRESARYHEFCPDWLRLLSKPTNSEKMNAHRKMQPQNVLICLDPCSLRNIHPSYDSEEGLDRCYILNIVAFGGRFPFVNDSDMSDLEIFVGSRPKYGNVLRAANSLGISKENFDNHLRSLIKNDIITCFSSESNDFMLSATAFLADAVLLVENEAEIIRLRKQKGYLKRKERSSLEQKAQEHSQRLKMARDEKIQRTAEKTEKENPNMICVGVGEIRCVYGKEGNPTTVDENWKEFFSFSEKANGEILRNNQCLKCEREKRRLKRAEPGNIISRLVNSAANRHISISTPLASLKNAMQKMVSKYTHCALCGGNFDETMCFTETPVAIPKYPWSRSYNVVDPKENKYFYSVEELCEKGNIVHIACNYAQNDEKFEHVVEICRFIATKIPSLDSSWAEKHQKLIDTTKLSSLVTSNLMSALESHRVSQKRAMSLIANSFNQFEHYTGLSLGFGEDFDLNLNAYDEWPFLLKLTVDRIDVWIPDGPLAPLDNYCITFRIINWVKSTFPPSVVKCWLENIIKKYK